MHCIVQLKLDLHCRDLYNLLLMPINYQNIIRLEPRPQ